MTLNTQLLSTALTLTAAGMSSQTVTTTAADTVATEASIGVLPSPDRTAAARLPKRLSDITAIAADAATSKPSPSRLQRRLSRASLNDVSITSSTSHLAAPSPSRSGLSLPSSLHSRVLDALTALHRQPHLHQSPPPTDYNPSMSSAALSFAHTPPRLRRSISASAVEEEVCTSEAAKAEEAVDWDDFGSLPVFITSAHDPHKPTEHLSAAAPHIQAAFPLHAAAAGESLPAEVEDEQDEDSTPLLVSSQPSSPAYTSSHTISTTRKGIPTSTGSPLSSSSSLSTSSTSSTSALRSAPPSYSPSPLPHTFRHPIDKPPRCNRTTCGLSIFLSLLALTSVFFLFLLPRIVLYFTTGSALYREFDWYNASNAARRLYPDSYTADGQYSEEALAALHEATCPAPANRTNPMPTINVAPAADGVTHLHIMVASDSWTLFPWFWDSILVNHTWADPTLEPTPVHCTPTNNCHRCADDLSLSPHCHKWFPDQRLAVHLMNYPIDRRLLPNITTLLIVGQWHMDSDMYDWLKSDHIAPLLHPNFHLMTLLLMGEECLNWRGDWSTLQWKIHPRLAATFTTYGDCHLNPAYHQLRETELPNQQPIDMSNNVVYWPLGPSVEHGFQSRSLSEELDSNSAERERELLLNLMVSITPEKSSRMQAWLATTQYCQQHADARCYNYNNDLLWKAIKHVDDFIGASIRDLLPIHNPTASQYLPLLANSTYTLCPAGKNPEQYRIWEALMVGSIPVIEDPSSRWTDEPFIHPAYGLHHRCTRYDVHRVLRKYRAPVLFVDDWRQLNSVLNALTAQQVVERRRELKLWFQHLRVELRREMFERVKHLNGRREGD